MGMLAVLAMVGAIPLVTGGGLRDPAPAPVTMQAPAGPLLPSAARAPVQRRVAPRVVDMGQGRTATLKAAYAIEGAVLTRARYRFGPHAGISPLDLGIVTGPMSRPDRFGSLEGGASGRVASVRWEPGAVPPGMEGAEWFTNNHLIPATDAVRDALLAVRRGDRLRLEGYLVDVRAPGMAVWGSSERRDDVWCEIVLVTAAKAIAGGNPG